MPMHIALAGPIAGEDIRHLLHDPAAAVPRGYVGAPLTAILIGELLRLGHRVTGITTDPGLPLAGGPMHCEGPQFRFVACPARPRAWRFNGRLPGRALDLFAFERRVLARAMTDAAPDIVHAHWSYEFALAAIDHGAPHLITCHDAPGVVLRFTRSPYRAARWLMAREVFRRGHAFTTVSDYMARELAPALGHTPVVIPNPVAPQVLALGRPRAEAAARRVAMVCNGWDRRKNPEPALRAFALWRRTEPRAELHLYGADFGPGQHAAQWAQAQGLGDGLHLHGSMPHRELIAALAGMDALLHPAREESFGVVLAEAMALGLPVVAGRHSGAVPWVLGAVSGGEAPTGVLADVNSPDALAAALQALFGAGYAQRSAAGIARARAVFAPASVAAAYEARCLQVVRGAASGAAAPAALRPEVLQ